MIFDLDFEILDIEEPSKEYYEVILKESVRTKGYKISKKVNNMKLIDDLNRVITRMKYDKEGRIKGLTTSDSHMAAVFMGEPGTAKLL